MSCNGIYGILFLLKNGWAVVHVTFHKWICTICWRYCIKGNIVPKKLQFADDFFVFFPGLRWCFLAHDKVLVSICLRYGGEDKEMIVRSCAYGANLEYLVISSSWSTTEPDTYRTEGSVTGLGAVLAVGEAFWWSVFWRNCMTLNADCDETGASRLSCEDHIFLRAQLRG